MFVPVQIKLGAGDETSALYDRSIELTARQLLAFERESADMSEPLGQIGSDLHTQIAAAFASEGATGASGKWTQLSPDHRTWKEAHRPGVPMLVGLRPALKRTRSSPRKPPQTYEVSGQMMRQLLVPLSDRSAWHVDPRRLLYTPLSDIAGYHETGTDKMPARPPVDVSLTFLHSVDRAFVRWLAGLIRKVGL